MPKIAKKKSTRPARRRPTNQSRGEETRARVLEAALEQFLQHGFHGTNMRGIAATAGVAVGGIYNHFDNKEAIFAAVLDAYHPYHLVMPALEKTQGRDSEAFIRDAARLIHDGIRGSEDRLIPLMFIELLEFQGRHLTDMAERVFPQVLVFVQRLAEHSGQLRPIPLPVVLRTLMGLMIGYLMTDLILRNVPFIQQMDYDWFGGTLDVYLHGLIADDGRLGRPALAEA